MVGKAVRKKWHTPEDKEWWYTKFTLARRLKTTKLFEKQGGLCYFCGQQTWLPGDTPLSNNKRATLEHVLGQAKGGTDHMSNLVMSCSGCNNLRGEMKFNKFLKLRRDAEAWRIYCKARAGALQERKVKVKEKRQPAQAAFIWKIAVLLYVRPEWASVVEDIRQHFAAIAAKKKARHEQRVVNSPLDLKDIS